MIKLKTREVKQEYGYGCCKTQLIQTMYGYSGDSIEVKLTVQGNKEELEDLFNSSEFELSLSAIKRLSVNVL